jgi:hypothetical protein
MRVFGFCINIGLGSVELPVAGIAQLLSQAAAVRQGEEQWSLRTDFAGGKRV